MAFSRTKLALSLLLLAASAVAGEGRDGWTLREKKSFTGLQDDVFSVALSADGRCVAAGYWDEEKVTVWDAKSGRKLTEIDFGTRAWSLDFSDDGAMLAVGGSHSEIMVYDTRKWAQLKKQDGDKGVAFLPGGHRLVHARNRQLKAVDIGTGRGVWSVDGPGRFWTIACSRNGKLIVSGAEDGHLRLHMSINGKEVRRYQVEAGKRSAFHRVMISDDGRRVACIIGPTEARLWNVETGARIKLGIDRSRAGSERAALMPDGKTIVVGRGLELLAFDATTGKLTRRVKSPDSSISTMGVSDDGKQVITGSNKGVVRLWDVMKAGSGR